MNSIEKLNICASIGSLLCISICVFLFSTVFEECLFLEENLHTEMHNIQKKSAQIASIIAEIKGFENSGEVKTRRQRQIARSVFQSYHGYPAKPIVFASKTQEKPSTEDDSLSDEYQEQGFISYEDERNIDSDDLDTGEIEYEDENASTTSPSILTTITTKLTTKLTTILPQMTQKMITPKKLHLRTISNSIKTTTERSTTKGKTQKPKTTKGSTPSKALTSALTKRTPTTKNRSPSTTPIPLTDADAPKNQRLRSIQSFPTPQRLQFANPSSYEFNPIGPTRGPVPSRRPFYSSTTPPSYGERPRCVMKRAEECPRGAPGPPGDRGTDGSDGENGRQGQPGNDADDVQAEMPILSGCTICPPGPTGRPGLPGKKGIRGLRGAMGTSGLPGRNGAPGTPGISGPDGPDGPDGQIGEPGNAGIDGTAGVGLRGEKGLQGKPGMQGEQGEQGGDGREGVRGEEGEQGEMGPRGKPGLDGQQGEKGEEGEPGEDSEYCPCPHRVYSRVELLRSLI
ncbi:unnamed protein product, partial [Mesorhabditis belari]|uniref:Collagen n=1 Tax=Mesorhabditis belari TaxID=2138241 RepID=A0AAF3F0Z7_9BILA